MLFSLPFGRAWRSASTHAYRPLTERLLDGSDVPRSALIAALMLLPWLRELWQFLLLRDAGLVGGAWLAARVPTALTNAYLILLTIWGTARVARQLARLQDPAAADGTAAPTRPPSSLGTWLLPPVALSVGLTLVLEAGRVAEVGMSAAAQTPLAFVASATIGFVMRLAPMTGFWTAVLVLTSLERIGAPHIDPEKFPPDRSLGMRPVGELAFSVFWMSTAAFVPILVIRSPSPVDVALTVGFFAVAGAILVAALWRLHRAMATARAVCVAEARERYAEAYNAAQEDTDGRDLGRRADALQLAEGLLRGAEAIQEWPLDERMIRWVAIIVTGVTTGVAIRFLTLPFGV